MSWYKDGTVSLTNGNATVAGVGTLFVANVQAGFAFIGPDFHVYEVLSITNDTTLVLANTYLGVTASGQAYNIFQTQGIIASLSAQVAALLVTFGPLRIGATAAALAQAWASQLTTTVDGTSYSANQYALNAAGSATSASSSATTATTQASNAATSASGASTSASNASSSATSASTSAGTAITQASNASTSASGASTSASTATTQASNAATSATAAAASAATVGFAQNVSTTTGLVYGFYTGSIRVDNTVNTAATGTITLPASSTSYVQVSTAGVVSSNTVGFTARYFPMAVVVTGVSTVSSVADKRSFAAVPTTAVVATSMNGGPLAGFRNRIMNGAINIDQRNSGASTTPGSGGTYVVDRFQYVSGIASKLTAQQVNSQVGNFPNSLVLTSTSAYASVAGDYFYVAQKIEGSNVQDFMWGTSSAIPVTLSFTVSSSVTGTFGGVIQNSAANRSYPFTYVITTANTATTISVTIPGDTIGTWLTGNAIGVAVIWNLGTGTTYSGPSNTWAAANYVNANGTVSLVATNGAVLKITGVQLEAGSVATPFENRPIGAELVLCQRYYNAGVNFGAQGYVITNSSLSAAKSFLTMRAIPTVAFTNTSYVNSSALSTLTTGYDGFVAAANGTAAGNANFFTYWSGSAEL